MVKKVKKSDHELMKNMRRKREYSLTRIKKGRNGGLIFTDVLINHDGQPTNSEIHSMEKIYKLYKTKPYLFSDLLREKFGIMEIKKSNLVGKYLTIPPSLRTDLSWLISSDIPEKDNSIPTKIKDIKIEDIVF